MVIQKYIKIPIQLISISLALDNFDNLSWVLVVHVLRISPRDEIDLRHLADLIISFMSAIFSSLGHRLSLAVLRATQSITKCKPSTTAFRP